MLINKCEIKIVFQIAFLCDIVQKIILVLHSTELMMHLKTDTKEKFTVITPEESMVSANMSAEFILFLQSYLSLQVPHVILNAKYIQQIDPEVLIKIMETQQVFYNDNHSFVICELAASIVAQLEKMDMLDSMNITPTESEAWDIVQMEEIERELLRDMED